VIAGVQGRPQRLWGSGYGDRRKTASELCAVSLGRLWKLMR